MYKKSHRTRSLSSRCTILSFAFVAVGTIAGCATSQDAGDELLPADEMLQGPGLFSGEDGSFNIITLNKDGTYKSAKTPSAENTPQDISNEDLQGTSDILDQKIQELEQQQEELEQLKREVKKKLETN